ncbi:MAG: EamA family transporter [Candidatus Pacebacteria bacterium]|nr:EamA family transporter [Candidatus Paceibacterota bacterium]
MLYLLSPVLYAAANLADKILVTGDDEDTDPGALLALSGMFAGLFAILFGLFIVYTGRPLGEIADILMLISIGAIYYSAIWIYLAMLKEDDTSNVTAWFQIIPLFGVVGAFVVLKEVPQLYQICAIPLIVLGGFLLSYQKGEMNKTIVFWMIVSAGLVALYDISFAQYGRDIDEFSAIFFMLLGKTVSGFVVLAIDKKAQRGFMLGIKTRIKTQFISESINTTADISLYASLLFYPVLLVQGISALQPMCVLIGAVIFGGIYPQIKEDTEGTSLYKKIIGLVLMIAGGIFIT